MKSRYALAWRRCHILCLHGEGAEGLKGRPHVDAISHVVGGSCIEENLGLQ